MLKQNILLCLFFLLLTAFYLRGVIGLRWDEGQHLHPDERFLTMVTNDIRIPDSLTTYLNSKKSPLSPYRKYGFFVYGTFPVFLTKIIANLTNYDNYDGIPIVGRIISSFFDTATILLIFLIGSRLYNAQVGLLAAAFLSFCVLNIQLSHFYGVETQAAFFVALAFYLNTLILEKGSLKYAALGFKNKLFIFCLLGLSFGLALSSKISTIYFLPIIFFITFFPLFGTLNLKIIFDKFIKLPSLKDVASLSCFLLITGVVTAFTFRFFQPYAFSGSSLLDFTLADKFVANMDEIRSAMKGADMPPAIQWVNRTPVLFSLYNIVFWHTGFLLGVSIAAGMIFMLYEAIYKNKLINLLPLSWAVLWLLMQSTQFVKAGRYLSVAYPFFLLIAAYFLLHLSGIVKRKGNLIWLSVLAFTFFWALAFINIYLKPHPRVAASYWIYDNIPCGTALGNEHWDDGLPLRVGGKDGFGGCYKGIEFNHYWLDDDKKLEDTISKIAAADFIILSSNRLYMSIPRLPKRFPFTIEYYNMLFSGELGFDLVKTFTSYPSLLGFEFNSLNAEESFTVYDHPKVLIFKKNSERFNIEIVKNRLTNMPRGIHEPLVKR